MAARAADLSHSRAVLLLRASASAMPASGPSLLLPSLRTRRWKGEKGRVPRAVGPPLAEQANPSALGSRAGLAARTRAW